MSRGRIFEDCPSCGEAARGALSMLLLGLALMTVATAGAATNPHKSLGKPLPSPTHARKGSSLAKQDNPLLHLIPFQKHFGHRLAIPAPTPSRPTVSANLGPAPSPRPRDRSFFRDTGGKYPWKQKIVTTVFWVGESAAPPRNPVSNFGSAWDHNWMQHYGGVDTPHSAARTQYIPATFVPRQNPFYCALPYNDVLTKGVTKPEARFVIPWFPQTFQQEGVSVCKDRWVAIRNHEGRVCYAQWSDVGPFRTDHWQYVFGNDRPKPNLNDGAGLDVSPAVRDFLGLRGMDATDWKFADFSEVPKGPWDRYGDNNNFVMARRKDFIFASR